MKSKAINHIHIIVLICGFALGVLASTIVASNQFKFQRLKNLSLSINLESLVTDICELEENDRDRLARVKKQAREMAKKHNFIVDNEKEN